MSRIVRWDPFRDMVAMRSQMDHIMDEWLRASNAVENGEGQAMRLAVDVSENENNFVIKASMPGINPDDLDISFSDNTLIIKGESRDEHVEENTRFHLRERRFGQFMRAITLPLAVNSEQIDAQYEHGVLVLTLPKAEETKPRKISVRNSQPVVEG